MVGRKYYNMKMREVIDGVSKLYRTERQEIDILRKELESIQNTITNAYQSDWKNISVAEYNQLKERYEAITHMINLKERYADGISCVREYLMDLGFDTKVEQHFTCPSIME
jgi:hypothetical protein